MESENSGYGEPQTAVASEQNQDSSQQQWFSEKFDSLLPEIQERWPDLAQQTLEATKGSLDELINIIAEHSGINTVHAKEQLEELFNKATNKTKDFAQQLEPLEKQLEELIDELNSTLRPKLEKPIRQKPLVAIGIAAAAGILLGILMTNGGGKR